MSSLVGRSPAGDKIWDERVVPNTLRRLPADVQSIRRSLKDVVLKTENGPQEAVAFEIDETRLERFVVRLVKGLLTHHYPVYDYTTSFFEVRFIPLVQENLEFLAPYRDYLQFAEKGDSVFRYRHGLSGTQKSGFWMLTFYDAILIMARHAQRPEYGASP